MEIENILIRLRETTAEINRATDNPGIKASMETTWTLQDRLVLPDRVRSLDPRTLAASIDRPQRLDPGSRAIIRSFGPIQLCGALHVCWQSNSGVNGQYMVTLLYKHCLVLATASKTDKTDQIYTIQACISLDSVRIEEADNGRGMFPTPLDFLGSFDRITGC